MDIWKWMCLWKTIAVDVIENADKYTLEQVEYSHGWLMWMNKAITSERNRQNADLNKSL